MGTSPEKSGTRGFTQASRLQNDFQNKTKVGRAVRYGKHRLIANVTTPPPVFNRASYPLRLQ